MDNEKHTAVKFLLLEVKISSILVHVTNTSLRPHWPLIMPLN
jgi:hypothetical protein